jgi:hypothetical protein
MEPTTMWQLLAALLAVLASYAFLRRERFGFGNWLVQKNRGFWTGDEVSKSTHRSLPLPLI